MAVLALLDRGLQGAPAAEPWPCPWARPLAQPWLGLEDARLLAVSGGPVLQLLPPSHADGPGSASSAVGGWTAATEVQRGACEQLLAQEAERRSHRGFAGLAGAEEDTCAWYQGHHGVRGLFAAILSRRKQLDLPHLLCFTFQIRRREAGQ